MIPRSPNSSRSSRKRGSGSNHNNNNNNNYGNYNLEYSGKIPLASKFVFFVLLFGIILTLIVMGASAYLAFDTKGESTANHTDISNIVLPLVIYIMDIVECSLFYLEARTFQMKGYTQLFQDASKLCKINFRLVSIYYVISYGIYAFLSHHTDDHHWLDQQELNIVFVAIWYCSYVFIIGSLCLFGLKFVKHNRDKPKPDLFFPNPNNKNYIANSPRIQSQQKRGSKQHHHHQQQQQIINGIGDDQTEVIQKLYKDKSTLMRQLDSMTKKYERTQRELQQLQSETSSILGTGIGDNEIDTNNINGNGALIPNSELIELKAQVQKLRSKLRSEREENKTLNTQIETKKNMLDASVTENLQLKTRLSAKDDRIAQLMNEKESLERTIHAGNDQRDDLLLLYQVKEQEVEIATKENERLLKKLQQLTMHNVDQHY